MDLWHPRAQRVTPADGHTGLSFIGVPWKICLHTTESSGYTPDRSSYFGNPFWPHATITSGIIYQHLPINVGAYALAHDPGTAETNRANMIQCEIVWRADDPNWPDDLLATVADWVSWVQSQTGVPTEFAEMYRDGVTLASVDSPIRYSDAEGPGLNLILGHSNVWGGNCVTPDTPVLCADLAWRPAGALVVGDELIAPEEYPTLPDRGRLLTTAVVEYAEPGRKPCVRVTTDKGSVVCSTDHPWLRHDPRGTSRWVWSPAESLVPDQRLSWFVEPWRADRSWSAGWLAGLLDADGSLSFNVRTDKGRFWTLAFGQREGQTLLDYEMEMGRRGFVVKVVPRGIRPATLAKQPFFDVRLLGGKREVFRLLGSLRPPRLLAHPRIRELWEGTALGKTTAGSFASVVSVEPVGDRDIASIQTSSRTFIAAGMPCHNTHWDPGRLPVDRLRALLDPTPVPPTPQEAQHMDMHLAADNHEDWLWMGSARIMGRIPVSGVYGVLKETGVPSIQVDAATLDTFKSWAQNAGFSG